MIINEYQATHLNTMGSIAVCEATKTRVEISADLKQLCVYFNGVPCLFKLDQVAAYDTEQMETPSQSGVEE